MIDIRTNFELNLTDRDRRSDMDIDTEALKKSLSQSRKKLASLRSDGDTGNANGGKTTIYIVAVFKGQVANL